MPSTNHRSCSQSDRSRRTQTNAPITAPRSSSVPNRQFIIILTNHSDIVRRTTAFRPRIENQQIQTTISIQNNSNDHRTVTNTNTNTTYDNHRERILNNLLRVELNEVIRNYLSRTRRSFPIHYVFDMSDIDLTTPTTTTATTSHLP